MKVSNIQCPKCRSQETEQIWGWGEVYQDYKCRKCLCLFTRDRKGKIKILRTPNE